MSLYVFFVILLWQLCHKIGGNVKLPAYMKGILFRCTCESKSSSWLKKNIDIWSFFHSFPFFYFKKFKSSVKTKILYLCIYIYISLCLPLSLYPSSIHLSPSLSLSLSSHLSVISKQYNHIQEKQYNKRVCTPQRAVIFKF